MNFQQQSDVRFPGNISIVADAPWGTTAFPVPQHLQSAPTSYRRPVLGQPHGHAGVVRDAVFPPADAAGDYRPNEDWENMPSRVENTAAQGQPQDLQYAADMGPYDMVNDHPPLRQHGDHAINNYAGVAIDVPAPAPAAPPAPEIDTFDGPARNTAAGPARVFLDGRPPQGIVPSGLTNEVLRQLAIVYLREPNSQVVMIRMGPGHPHGVRVVITVDLVDL